MRKFFTSIVVYIAAGWLLSRIRGVKWEVALDAVVNIAMYLCIPVLGLFALWTFPGDIADYGLFMCIPLIVIAGGYAYTFLGARILRKPFRELVLPVTFMNSTYLALPVVALFYGATGLAYGMLYNIVVSVVFMTAGIAAVSKNNQIRNLLRFPFIYAAVCGYLLQHFSVPVSPHALGIYAVISAITMPMMLILVGLQIGSFSKKYFLPGLIASFLRIAGGGLTALAAVYMLGINAPFSAIAILCSIMPSAVASFILNRKFDANAEFAAAVVTISTVIGIAGIPFVWRILL